MKPEHNFYYYFGDGEWVGMVLVILLMIKASLKQLRP